MARGSKVFCFRERERKRGACITVNNQYSTSSRAKEDAVADSVHSFFIKTTMGDIDITKAFHYVADGGPGRLLHCVQNDDWGPAEVRSFLKVCVRLVSLEREGCFRRRAIYTTHSAR